MHEFRCSTRMGATPEVFQIIRTTLYFPRHYDWFLILSVLFVFFTGHSSLAESPSPGQVPTAEDYDDFVQESDREHWAFQPVVRPPVPKIKNGNWVRNPVDAFILEKLESRHWSPNPSAAPSQLQRRLAFDLTGLPPSLSEQDELSSTPTLNSAEVMAWFDRYVDELLARPSYGERWGRHWLDLVRYAESNGYERDGTKPHAWRYRDYVITAFNTDKPYNRFVMEQLAGDELQDASSETVIATGFCRLGPWDDEPADPKEDRFDQLDDIVNTTAQSFLGLTLACARCHNHKFEPFSALDYYRMVAIFAPLQRPQSGRTDLDAPAGSSAQLAAQLDRDSRLALIQNQIDVWHQTQRDAFLGTGKSRLSGEIIEAFRIAAKDRTDLQKRLVTENLSKLDREWSDQLSQCEKEPLSDLQKRLTAVRQSQPDLPRGYFFRETSANPPATHVLIRGKSGSPGAIAPPGFPKVLTRLQPQFALDRTGTTGRRLKLAEWLTQPAHPLTARVFVNRVWQFHFGQGLVRTPSDFGIMGVSPTHPELLDWMADWFVHDANWSVKQLHRLILTSNTYRMSKAWNTEYGEKDPSNALLWSFPYRRLEVEPICDSILAVSGRLNQQMYGPSMYPHIPRQVLEGHSDPSVVWPAFHEQDASRRTVYAFIKRSLVVPMFEVLDLCDTTRSAAQRNVTSVAPQALTMMNGDFVNRQAEHFSRRLENEAGMDTTNQITLAIRLALCRPPTAQEIVILKQYLQREFQHQITVNSAGSAERARHRALVQLCRAIFNLNEFVYTD